MNKQKLTKAAATIVANQEAIRNNWRKIDYYKKYNTIVSNTEAKVFARNVADMSIGQIITACFTLPPYISKYQKNTIPCPMAPKK